MKKPTTMLLACLLLFAPAAFAQTTDGDVGVCYHCSQRFLYEFTYDHVASYGFESGFSRGHGQHSWEVWGSCDNGGHYLGCGFAQAEEILELIDRVGLKAPYLATFNHESGSLNAGRKAFQIRDCKGAVIAHFPLSEGPSIARVSPARLKKG